MTTKSVTLWPYDLTEADIGIIGKAAHLANTGNEGYIPFEEWEITLTTLSIDELIDSSKSWHSVGEKTEGKIVENCWVIFRDSKIDGIGKRESIVAVDLGECRALVNL